MPNLIDLRRRIRSVKNTQQITSAMKMVSAAKLRRAQEQVLAARPYAGLLKDMLESVLARVPEDAPARSHPLLEQRPPQHVILVVLSGDKGLCGSFNTNVIRGAERFAQERPGSDVQLELIGRRGRDYFRRRQAHVTGDRVNLFNKPIEYSTAEEIAGKLIERFAHRKADAVYLLYNEFKSAMAQRVTLDGLLPIQAPASPAGSLGDYIYLQPPEQLFAELLPKYVTVNIYRALLESSAAEHAARMTAMDAATRNAGEMIEKLTLYMNRVRQASITTELIEVVSGAQALQ
jgi:F-type H+-transporting ATPase subunit gamma